MIDRIPLKNEPRLMEAVVQQMQVQLGAGLSWLDHIFGKAERVEHNISELRQYYQKHLHDEPFYTPAVYIGQGKYERIVPDKQDWGNYAFFYLERRQELGDQTRVMPYFRLKGTVNLIIWGDLRTIEREDDRNIEAVKSDILQCLGGMRLTDAQVRWNEVFENCDEVWREYSIKEVVGKMMMHPYFCFRFVGEIECDTGCVMG